MGSTSYRGETDPRKLSLCVAGPRIPLLIEKVKHVRIQDLVVRGSSKATIAMDGAKDVELEGVTAFGGSPALMMDSCERIRIVHSAFRGISAPWSSRAGHKYRGSAAYVMVVRAKTGP